MIFKQFLNVDYYWRKNFTFAYPNGKLPEWSIGLDSKSSVRVTVPGVRIPRFPHIYNNPEAQSVYGILY